MMTPEQDALIQFIKVGLNKGDGIRLSSEIRWKQFIKLLINQGVFAIAYDGLQRVYSEDFKIDDTTKRILESLNDEKFEEKRIEWSLLSMQETLSYKTAEKTIAKLASFYANHGIEMMLLKGYGLNQYYPIRTSRHIGDLDIYLFGKWQEADKALSEELGIKISKEHEHHTTFEYEGYMVENHYDFVNVSTRRSNKKIEKEFKQLATDKSHFTLVDEQKVILPSPNLNALFLLRHSAMHFAIDVITIRHILDWGLFVEKEGAKINWEWLLERARYYNMHRFFSCINHICVDYLGFDEKKIPNTEKDETLEKKILNEIFTSQKNQYGSSSLGHIKRWISHRWQYRICFNDPFLSSFIRTTISYLNLRVTQKHQTT